jgi:hypothetical protein
MSRIVIVILIYRRHKPIEYRHSASSRHLFYVAVSVLERRCSKRGGACTPKTRCGRQLWDDHAKDCSQNEACCILVE